MSKVIRDRKGQATLRLKSLDCAGDGSSPEADEDEEAVSDQHFVFLADYMALTSQEIDLNEDEVVELIKVGCAGLKWPPGFWFFQVDIIIYS